MDKLDRRILPAFLALLLTAALPGCRQETLPAARDAIRFSAGSAGLASSTKASMTTEDDLMQGKALLYGKAGTATVFAGVELNCANGSYGALRYWDKRYTYDFRAVFPSTTVPDSGSGEQIVVTYDIADDNYDLMVASAPGIVAATRLASGNNDPVSLKFRHACAAVRILFEDASGAAAPNYYVHHFELQQLYRAGTLTYVGNSASAEVTYGGTAGEWQYSAARTTVLSWTAASGAARWLVPLPPETAPYTADNTLNGIDWYYVIPQTLDDGSKLHFSYTVGNGNTAQILPVTLDLKIGGIEAWEPGTVYTYKIQLRANAVTLGVQWGDWQGADEHIFDPVG